MSNLRAASVPTASLAASTVSVRPAVPAADLRGLVSGLGAYACWGFVPLYFKALAHVPALDVLTHRIVWSMLLLGGVLTVWGRWGALLAALRQPKQFAYLLASAVLIAANWLIYVHAVSSAQVVQASLGYFACPLLTVVLGVVVYRERLRPIQWAAVALAAAGVGYWAVRLGEPPWLALGLAATFGLYGLLRKRAAVDSVVGLTVETILLAPAALAYLSWLLWNGQEALGAHGWRTDLLLLSAGAVTTVPLILYVEGARRLPLSLLGMLQYTSPTLQLLLGVFAFGEALDGDRLASFAAIWLAIGLFTGDALTAQRRRAASRG